LVVKCSTRLKIRRRKERLEEEKCSLNNSFSRKNQCKGNKKEMLTGPREGQVISDLKVGLKARIVASKERVR
jgi:hypothetical protein